jgi:hypothetical protein
VVLRRRLVHVGFLSHIVVIHSRFKHVFMHAGLGFTSLPDRVGSGNGSFLRKGQRAAHLTSRPAGS